MLRSVDPEIEAEAGAAYFMKLSDLGVPLTVAVQMSTAWVAARISTLIMSTDDDDQEGEAWRDG